VFERRTPGSEVEFTSGLALAGLGVHGLLLLRVSDRGVQIAPSGRLLAAVGVPAFEVIWDDVAGIDTLCGPFGGIHGVRLVLVRRGAVTNIRGLARIFGPMARRPLIGLAEADVEKFLALAPARIPRRRQRGLFWWP
jgi:hypothetical protein